MCCIQSCSKSKDANTTASTTLPPLHLSDLVFPNQTLHTKLQTFWTPNLHWKKQSYYFTYIDENKIKEQNKTDVCSNHTNTV